MTERARFFIALVGVLVFVIGVVIAALLVAASGIPDADRAAITVALDSQTGLLLVFAAFLLTGLGFIVHALFSAYVSSMRTLADGTQTILLANPGHRLPPAGPPEAKRLAAAINAIAERHQALLAEIEARVRDANADLEEEKNRLAALMSELAQSVIVCNADGTILLYNLSARQLLSPEQGAADSAGGYVGLGRSVFGVLERNPIAHALDQVRRKVGEETANPSAQFVTTARNGRLVRAQVAPVTDRNRAISGFVLTLEDVTRAVEASMQRDIALQSLVEDTRRSIASVRAAIENIIDYPDMETASRNRFAAIIRDEAVALTERIGDAIERHSGLMQMQWPLEEIRASDLIGAIRSRAEEEIGMVASGDVTDDSLWLHADSYSVVRAMLYVMGRLRDNHGIRQVSVEMVRAGRFAQLDLVWHGVAVDADEARAWDTQPLLIDGRGSPLTLKQVSERHGGEIWHRTDPVADRAYFRMLLPTVKSPERPTGTVRRGDSRPEYYDFDLFHRPGQEFASDERWLGELSYTVFDTETTGLNPSAGDEIISIGAVRIVNGRLLRDEIFDQLIDPGRPVPRESTRIHGITNRMLQDQPRLAAVLHAFHRFAEETVLVAHNAAFDMRFLQLKEELTGVRFLQPVLDTMLLSAVVRPEGREHELETNASRFGIDVIGRHTSLGDAIVTGEIFLKLIPLLAERGIHTLRQAREASERTYLARIDY